MQNAREIYGILFRAASEALLTADPKRLGAAIGFLQALQDCLISIDDEHRSDVKRFSSVVRSNKWVTDANGKRKEAITDPKAWQRFFARAMSAKMKEICGHPRRDVVATLVCVAFNVDDVTTDTVREWCRKTGT